MLNRWMTTGIITVAIIILISVTHAQVYAENMTAAKPLSETAALEKLLHTADSMIDRTDRLVIKWQAGGKGNAQEHAVKLALELGLAAPVQMWQNGHQVYRSEDTIRAEISGQSTRVLLNAVDTDDEGYYIIVQLSGGRNLDRNTLLTWHGQMAEVMEELGMKASWNMSVQGMVDETATDIKPETDGQLAVMEAKLSRTMKMKAVERYEDEATASISYQAADLPLAIQSGTHRLNMQLAVHQVSGQQAARVTVGFPLITIEY
ncbi:YwmB family TATA-box binding protein [Paenibacillus silvae]|uniref:YwmB family TATA-box binding protein n=1 Tax=Paenibacillus silvae TaxID=1325358 RepID=UPI003CF91D60